MKNSSEINSLKEIFALGKDRALDDYFKFLKFQSISSEPLFRDEVFACAEWVKNYLERIGFTVELWPTSGYPTIFATHCKAGSVQPTLLIYNHYDVQPVDPLELWDTPPFEPIEKDNQVYARGAQDNKGQCFYVLYALKTLIEKEGGLPINIKLCIEGEEECGSAGLSQILHKKQRELKSDYLAVVDLGLYKPTIPAITLGVRGLVALDIEVISTYTDLHSGAHGGIAYNPIHALVKLLATLRDQSGKIQIPGFYDDIAKISEEELSQICLDFDPVEYEKEHGAKPIGGEKNFTPLERNWLRPTLEINGIQGGYSGEGLKTVIPAKARAKISCRLVPNQDPDKIGQLVACFLKENAPEGVKVSVIIHPGKGRALHTSPKSGVVKAFAQAFEEVFQKSCNFIYSGASIPIAAELASASQSEVVLFGMGLAEDLIHAPNEHFGIDRIEKGFLVVSRALNLLKNP